jgi:hypothetical protein
MSRSARPALPAVVAAIVAAGACLAWSWDVEAAEGGAAAGEIRNARLEERSAAAGLEPVFQAAREAGPDPAWAGYLVPATGLHDGCCGGGSEEGGCCGCRLEGGRAFASGSRPDDTARLEHGGRLWVLYRFEGGGVDKIRTFSEGCALDAGGLRFVRIAEVSPADSLRLLASFVPSGGEKGRLTEAALAAIAFHDDPGADALLESLTAPERPDRLRKKAAFWMGNARGRRGFETLKRLVGSDPSDGFREDVVFALTQSREPEATDVLIDTARRDASARVRGQALFWLAQRAGRKAAAAITRAIEDDPETEVKKKAVFALSQLPKDEGLPLLIRTARENRNPAVRRQAMFWLGQSGDPRALAFFEEVLKN